MKKTRIKRKSVFYIVVLIAFAVGLFAYPDTSQSAGLTSAKDTLSNSRLSYDASIDSGGVSSGETTITIDTGSVDDNTNHLFPGDTICFANNGYDGCIGNTTYTVGSILSSTKFTITSALGDALGDNDHVVATQSATHTVVFTTASAITNGSVLLKVPARDTSANSNDGFADTGSDSSNTQGFDLNSTAASDIACSGGAPTWGAETVTSSGSSSSGEHELIFPFTGTLAASTTVTCTITNKLINPAPASDHTQGTADDLQITIETYDHATPGSGNLVDNTDVSVAPIEAVFVSATVDETLAFSIGAVGTGATACGANPDVASTFNTVPFGTLTLNSFKDIAHDLEVSTNSPNGYAVTAIATDQMGRNGNTCTGDAGAGNNCIPDTTCDGGSCDHTAANIDDWETATNNGFGFSLDSNDGTDAAWEWDSTSGNCDGAGSDFCAGQFADEENSQSAVTVMSNAGAVNSKNVYVCYRVSVGATQPAGYYYNTVRYTATPTF